MSLGIPDDYDDAQPGESDDETTVMDGTEDEQTATDKPAAEHRRDLDGAIGELRENLKAQSSVIGSKADVAEIEALRERLSTLEQRLTDLEDSHQMMHDDVLKLDEYLREQPELSAEEVAAINTLSAAVFKNEPECPECGDGDLAPRLSLTGRYVVCSGENCEYKQRIRL
jgi:DNA repair exonuclease SbcCD ATPase subunit